MSEKTKKNVENVETVEAVETEKTEKKAEKPAKKQENWFKRMGKRIKKAMSDHPFLTAAGGACIGTAATVGVAEVGKAVVNRRQQKQQAVYIQEDVSTLDPNN